MGEVFMSWQAGSQKVSMIDAKARFLAGEALPDGLLPQVIARSWQRCLDRNVSAGRQTREIPVASSSVLTGLRDRSRRLITCSEPVMEQLYLQIRGTSSVVVLTDAAGVVMHSVGDPVFMGRAQQVALLPGGIWTEEANGTNAIGTVLVEQVPLSVHSGEHFVEKNQHLSCSAAPILDPLGRILGVLDVSSDAGNYQRHTSALVGLFAQMIENQYFTKEHGDEILVHFHLRPEMIGTSCEGIAAFSREGGFVAGNRVARSLLGLDRHNAGQRDISSIFEVTLAGLLEKARVAPQPVIRLRLRGDVEVSCWVRLGASVSPLSRPPIETPVSHQAADSGGDFGAGSLAALDLGDPVMGGAIRKAAKVIGHDIPLMIEGESGSGKEMFARALHADGPRGNGPFVALNCAAIPEGLIESELFGYREGAFTGARRSGCTGKILQADGGTLFLDEIGDMPLSLQARLLRVLQDRTVTPLGGTKPIPVNIKIACATNRRLRDEVAAGRFREDLYYRLNGLLITLPPLRDRLDRLPLFQKILSSVSGEGSNTAFSRQTLAIFERHPWPGNLRQLTNVVRTALALSEGEREITVDHLPEDFLEQYRPASSEPRKAGEENGAGTGSLEEAELRMIRETLRENDGNASAAARRLGIARSTLYRKLKGK